MQKNRKRKSMRSMVRATYAVQLKDRKIAKDVIQMLGLNETIDQLATAKSVHWHGNVLRRVDGHVMRMAFDYEVDSQRERVAKEDMVEAG